MTNTTTTTKRFRKEFNELTDSGKAARLRKYEEERAERGTVRVLGRLVSKPSVKEISGGAMNAYLVLAVYDKETEETDFITVSAYIAKDKVGTDLEAYYQNLEKGQLLSVEYKQNGDYKNAYGVFTRSVK